MTEITPDPHYEKPIPHPKNRFMALTINCTDMPTLFVDTHAPLDILTDAASYRIRAVTKVLENLSVRGPGTFFVWCLACDAISANWLASNCPQDWMGKGTDIFEGNKSVPFFSRFFPQKLFRSSRGCETLATAATFKPDLQPSTIDHDETHGAHRSVDPHLGKALKPTGWRGGSSRKRWPPQRSMT